MKDIEIELVDTSTWHVNHTATLKKETSRHLKRGVGIIYAWCHSLFTFCEKLLGKVDQDLEELQPDLIKNNNGQIIHPEKWVNLVPNPKFQKQKLAYDKARKLVDEMVKRDSKEYEETSDRAISSIVGKYWLWV